MGLLRNKFYKSEPKKIRVNERRARRRMKKQLKD